MQQLMEQNPLPTLFMRTVLQAMSMYPRLLGLVLNILQRLIKKQVSLTLLLYPLLSTESTQEDEWLFKNIKNKTKILMTNGSLMQVESIAECYP